MTRFHATLIGAVASLVLLNGAGQPVPRTTTIRIDQCQYQPASITVKPGETVVWVNVDRFRLPHNVVATAGAFKSPPALQPGDRFQWKAGKPGTYEYLSTLHPAMAGKVIVK